MLLLVSFKHLAWDMLKIEFLLYFEVACNYGRAYVGECGIILMIEAQTCELGLKFLDEKFVVRNTF